MLALSRTDTSKLLFLLFPPCAAAFSSASAATGMNSSGTFEMLASLRNHAGLSSFQRAQFSCVHAIPPDTSTRGRRR